MFGTELTRHIRHIDGVRAIAVGGVIALHAWEFHGPVGNPLLDRAFAMGAHGVDLFFVVSGFCLAYPILRAIRDGGEATFVPARFYAKRIVRILPPYYAAIAVLAVALPLLGMPTNGMDSASGILQQALFFDRHVVFLDRSFWTLAVEFRWYLLFPLLTILYVRSPRAFAALAFLLPLIYSLTRVDAVDLGALPGFMLGIWAADCEIRRLPIRRFAIPVFLAAAALAFAFEPGTGRAYYADEPLAFIAATAFVVASGAVRPLSRVLASRPFVALGLCSYSAYLVNDSVLQWAQTRAGIAALPAVGIALLAAALFWFAFERPTTSTRLRAILVAFCERWLARAFAYVGIPASVPISAHASAALPEPHVAAATRQRMLR